MWLSDHQTLLSYEAEMGDFDTADSEPKSDLGFGLRPNSPGVLSSIIV